MCMRLRADGGRRLLPESGLLPFGNKGLRANTRRG